MYFGVVDIDTVLRELVQDHSVSVGVARLAIKIELFVLLLHKGDFAQAEQTSTGSETMHVLAFTDVPFRRSDYG